MSRKQARNETSVQTPRIPAQFYVDPDEWDRFEEIARIQNRSRSAQLRELVQREIRKYDELEQAA